MNRTKTTNTAAGVVSGRVLFKTLNPDCEWRRLDLETKAAWQRKAEEQNASN